MTMTKNKSKDGWVSFSYPQTYLIESIDDVGDQGHRSIIFIVCINSKGYDIIASPPIYRDYPSNSSMAW